MTCCQSLSFIHFFFCISQRKSYFLSPYWDFDAIFLKKNQTKKPQTSVHLEEEYYESVTVAHFLLVGICGLIEMLKAVQSSVFKFVFSICHLEWNLFIAYTLLIFCLHTEMFVEHHKLFAYFTIVISFFMNNSYFRENLGYLVCWLKCTNNRLLITVVSGCLHWDLISDVLIQMQ